MIENSVLFFIDDTRNSGSTEKAINELCLEYNPKKISNFYILDIQQEQVEQDFSIENDLNCKIIEKDKEGRLKQDNLFEYLKSCFKDKNEGGAYDVWLENKEKHVITKRLIKVFVSNNMMNDQTFERFFNSNEIPLITKIIISNCLIGEGYLRKLSFEKQKIILNFIKKEKYQDK